MINSPIVESNDKKKVFLLFMVMISATILEVLGIGLIPAYIYMLSSFENIFQYLPNSLQFFKNYDKNILIVIFSIFLVSFFLIKNFIQIIIYKVEADIIFKLVAKNASKIFSFYINNPLEFHYQNNLLFPDYIRQNHN